MRDAARYLSIQTPGTPAEIDRARNLMVYGNLSGTGQPLAIGLTLANIVSRLLHLADAGSVVINTVTVRIRGYTFRSMFATVFGQQFGAIDLFRYLGHDEELSMRPVSMSRQSGATAVEFALVLLIFLTFLLAVTDFSRMLYTWNAANEATRAGGARYAAVCDDTFNQAAVLARMQALVPEISSINVVWEDALGNTSCTPATCVGVTVTIVGMRYKWISPIAGLGGLAPLQMPTFKTYLVREIMRQDPNSAVICL